MTTDNRRFHLIMLPSFLRHGWVRLCLLLVSLVALQPVEAHTCCDPNGCQPKNERRGTRGDRPRFDGERFKQELTAYVTREAGLTAAEAKQFFPLFFEMKEALRNLEHQKGQALRQAATAHMTERDCQRVLQVVANLDQKRERMEANYVKRLTRIVGARKMVKVLHADRMFGRHVFKKMTRR